MAYYDPTEDEQNGQGMSNQGQPQNPNAPVQSSSQSASIVPVQTGSQSTPAAKRPKPASSGSAATFQKYTQANQGTAQDKLNQSVAQNIQSQGSLAKGGINQATQQFGKKVEEGSLQNMGQAVSDVSGTVDAARKVQAQARAAAVNQASQQAQAVQQQASTAKTGLAKERTAPGNANLAKDSAPRVPVAPVAPILGDGQTESRNLYADPNYIPTTRAQRLSTSDTPTSSAPTNPLAGISQAQQDRFREVINARYQGPESLRQAGLYQDAAGKVQTAQRAIDNTKTAIGRENLLKDMYSPRGDYTAGLNKLDAALLNASKQGVANLQSTARAQGSLQGQLDQAQIGSANTAQNRTREIAGIQQKARQAFTQGKTAEEKATEDRLSAVEKNWEALPQFFRDAINNKAADNASMKERFLADYRRDNPFNESEFDRARQAYQEAYAKTKSMTRGPDLQAKVAYQRASEESDRLGELWKQQQAKRANYEKEVENSWNPNAVHLNPLEAQILGIQSGEGLYNLGANAIKSGQFNREEQISRDEQARQAALSALAGLDASNQLDTNLKYTNADIAGTKSALDALDLEGTRAALNEAEDKFAREADMNITGYGAKKNKTSGRKYYAQETANFKDLLANSGYNFDGANPTNTGDRKLLETAARISRGEVLQDPSERPGVQGGMDAYTSGFSNMGDGQSVPAGALDAFGSTSYLNALTGAAGLGSLSEVVAKAADSDPGKAYLNYNPGFAAGNAVTNALGMGNLSNAVGSLFGGGSSSAESKADAAYFARRNLERKIQDQIAASGFQNRVNVSDDEVVNTRLNALQQLLADMDKTNQS